jgi:hypothetical protein
MLVPALRGLFHFLLPRGCHRGQARSRNRTPTYPKRLTRHLSRESWSTGLRVLLWQEMPAGAGVQTVATDISLARPPPAAAHGPRPRD